MNRNRNVSVFDRNGQRKSWRHYQVHNTNWSSYQLPNLDSERYPRQFQRSWEIIRFTEIQCSRNRDRNQILLRRLWIRYWLLIITPDWLLILIWTLRWPHYYRTPLYYENSNRFRLMKSLVSSFSYASHSYKVVQTFPLDTLIRSKNLRKITKSNTRATVCRCELTFLLKTKSSSEHNAKIMEFKKQLTVTSVTIQRQFRVYSPRRRRLAIPTIGLCHSDQSSMSDYA